MPPSRRVAGAGAPFSTTAKSTSAAVVAAAANGLVEKGRDITVKAAGGDLTVNYTDEEVTLTGDAKLVFEGTVEY